MDREIAAGVGQIGDPLPRPYQSVVPVRVMHHVIKRLKVRFR